MIPTLNNLDLTPDELHVAEEAIRRMAYEKWLQAGSPPGDDLHFWSAAEQEWILFQYVPHRLPPQAEGDDPEREPSHVSKVPSAEAAPTDSLPAAAGSIV
jgi:hypothetical protein